MYVAIYIYICQPPQKKRLLLNYLDYQSSKVPKLHKPMSAGWLWSRHGVCSFAKLHKPMSPEWLWSGHGVCSFGTLSSKVPKTAQTYVPRVAVVGSWGLQFWNFGFLQEIVLYKNVQKHCKHYIANYVAFLKVVFLKSDPPANTLSLQNKVRIQCALNQK